MGNAIGCCAEESGGVLEKAEDINLTGNKKVMFGKKNHNETDSEEDDYSTEGNIHQQYVKSL